MSTRTIPALYGAAMTALAAAFVARQSWAPVLFLGAGVLSVVAVMVGVRRYRPPHVWPWALLAGGLAVSAVVDCIFLLQLQPTRSAGFSAADLLYGATLPAVVVVLLSLARTGSPSQERAWIVDALTATLALVMLVWVSVISPTLDGATPSAFDTAMLVIYPIAGVLLVASVVRFLRSRRRTAAVVLLVIGALSTLGANLLYALTAATGWYRPPVVADLGWLMFFAAWGGAALCPSMARLSITEPIRQREATIRRVAVLGLTSLAAPFVLLLEAMKGDVRDGILIAVASATIFLLSLARVADAANTHRRSLIHRERHDTLTGLANRSAFFNRVTAAVTDHRAGGTPGAVILITIVDLQLLNDTLGVSAVDEIVVAAGHRLGSLLGRHDLAARLASDEFALFIAMTPATATAARVDPAAGVDPEEVATRVAAAMAEPIAVDEVLFPLTTSIGVATTADADTAEEVLQCAGLAARAARTDGRGQWRRYQAKAHAPMVERMLLRSAIDRAVAEGAFRLRYQPIVSLQDGATVGLEALVRWEHPTRGLVPPAEFIGVAEETGAINQIGHFVLRDAVTTAVGWPAELPYQPYVSVNVSASQMRRPGFAQLVARELDDAGLPASRLMLELTESLLLRQDDHVWTELAQMRDTGVRLAIDDFGTGFSSLSYLQQSPIDVIKIDRSFVSTLATSSRQRAVVDGIARLASSLGLQVVAEGIETPTDRDLLVHMGCPYGQGYLYAKPLTSSEVVEWFSPGLG